MSMKSAMVVSLVFLVLVATLSGCGSIGDRGDFVSQVVYGASNCGLPNWQSEPAAQAAWDADVREAATVVNQLCKVECGDCGTTRPEPEMIALTGICLGVGDLKGAGQLLQWQTVVDRCDPADCIHDTVSNWSAAKTSILSYKKWTDEDLVHVFHVDGIAVHPGRPGEAGVLVKYLSKLPSSTGMMCSWDGNLFNEWTPSSGAEARTVTSGSSAAAAPAVAAPPVAKVNKMVVGINVDSSTIDCGVVDCIRDDTPKNGTQARDVIWDTIEHRGMVHVIWSGIRNHGGPDGEACVLIRNLPSVPDDGDGYVVVTWGCPNPLWPAWP